MFFKEICCILLILLFTSICSIYGAGITFIHEPKDVIIKAGQSVTLNCKAEWDSGAGKKPATIKWKNLKERELQRTQLSNGSLVLTNLFSGASEHTGTEQFQCIASIDNVGSAISRNATISLFSLPEFTKPSSNISSVVGHSVQIPCLVQSNAKVNISWIKNRRPLVIDESRMLNLPSGTLEIEDVQSSDSGEYQCTVSASGISGQGEVTFLTLGTVDASGHPSPPVFVSKPKNMVVKEGELAILECSANGFPRPTITWLKDGLDIDLEDLDSRFSRVGISSLQINQVQAEDEGNYVCRAGNREDSVDASAEVQVEVPPKFTKLPGDIRAHTKDDVEWECHVFGKPQPKVSWWKNGELIKQNDYMQINSNNNLHILGTLKLDSGIFQCVASNVAGNIQTSALLTVSDRENSPSLPEVGSGSSSEIEENTTVSSSTGPIESVNDTSDTLPSSPGTISAITVGPRSVALRWLPPLYPHGDIVMYCVIYKSDGSERERMFNTTSNSEEAIIQGLQPNITYHFRVVAYNDIGAGKASGVLTIRTESEDHVPSPPLNLNVPVISTRSMQVTWEKPAITNGVIQNYVLYYLEEDSSLERHVVTTELSYELTGLSVYTLYTLWVVAHNRNGAGITSVEISVQTLPDKPSEPPANVTLEASGTTSITVKWDPPLKKGQNGIITGYKIKYKKRDKKDKGEIVTTAGDKKQHVISGLSKGTVYQVRLWAINVNGSGPYTEWFTVETFENNLGEDTVPDSPATLKAKPGWNSILVSWTPPSDNSIMVRGYTIGWGKNIPDVNMKQISDPKQRSFEITNLEPNSEYIISLRAYNEMGDGPSKLDNLRTKIEPLVQTPKILTPPIGLKTVVLSPYSMKVSWIDTTVPEQFQYGEDGRYYLLRFTHLIGASIPRYKYVNSTDLSVVVHDLKPSTQYEFTVKTVRSKKESEWSMIVLNTTLEAAPSSPPRDLTVVPREDDPSVVNLNWQPPKSANGQISGYLILFSSDISSPVWIEESVVGDKMSTNVKSLQPSTTYFFKIQARNSAGSGPFSNVITMTTLSGEKSVMSNAMVFYMAGGGSIVLILYVVVVAIALCCCKSPREERSKKGYIKGNSGKQNVQQATQINPPDLWIHHDQMELKGMEKSSQGSLDTQLNTQVQPEYDPPKVHQNASTPSSNNSLEKQRVFVTSYIGLNNQTSENRPLYPASQYTLSRAHVTVDPSAVSSDNAYVVHTGHNHSGIEAAPGPPSSLAYGSMHAPQPTYNETSAAVSKVKRQGHPLKSFTVPAPPPTSSAPTTPQQKHIVTVRPQGSSSPYKKANQDSIWPESNAELTPLKPAYSTEELTQEMANLEGLMKDLNAITASEFKC